MLKFLFGRSSKIYYALESDQLERMNFSERLKSPLRPLLALVPLAALVLSVPSLCTAGAKTTTRKSTIDYNRDVRPILSENCYACHGPDSEKRKAGLRLDRQEGALGELKSGDHAIVPGDISKSALISRITAADEDDRMPPLKTGKHLAPAQIETLRRWIGEGAEWKKHWSFIPPERPALPSVRNQRWPKNSIDSFI